MIQSPEYAHGCGRAKVDSGPNTTARVRKAAVKYVPCTWLAPIGTHSSVLCRTYPRSPPESPAECKSSLRGGAVEDWRRAEPFEERTTNEGDRLVKRRPQTVSGRPKEAKWMRAKTRNTTCTALRPWTIPQLRAGFTLKTLTMASNWGCIPPTTELNYQPELTV